MAKNVSNTSPAELFKRKVSELAIRSLDILDFDSF